MLAKFDLSNLNQLMEARRNLYQFLHRVFYAPLDQAWLDAFREFGEIEGLGELGPGGAELRNFFNGEPCLNKEEAEFSRLFICPGTLPAPPWESFYRSSEQMLFDDVMYDVRDLYYSEGLRFVKENNEPDDHLVLELEFMIHLIVKGLQEKEMQELGSIFEKQRMFLDEHLGKWIGVFGNRLSHSTDSKLYRGAALMAADFIANDLDFLNELVEGLSHA